MPTQNIPHIIEINFPQHRESVKLYLMSNLAHFGGGDFQFLVQGFKQLSFYKQIYCRYILYFILNNLKFNFQV